MSPGLLTTIIGACLLFAGILFFVIFSIARGAIRRATARIMALLESEDIVLDSGKVPLTYRLRGFRAPGVYEGHGVRSGSGRLVLTRRRLRTIPISLGLTSVGDILLGDLARFQAGVGDGGLMLRTDDPPNARGSVEIVASVPNVEVWVKALADAGARPLVA